MNKSLPKKKTVELENKTIEIKKLGLGKYAEALRAINGLFEKAFGDLTDKIGNKMTEEAFLANVIMSFSDYTEEIFELIHIATYNSETKEYGLSVEELKETVDREEAIDIIQAIIEVNNLFGITDDIKKLKAAILKK